MIATTQEQSKILLDAGLDHKTSDMWYSEKYGLQMGHGYLRTPAWSLQALLNVMPRPDLYRETADLWVCATFFKEGSIRGFGKTAIEAACDTITKMFGRGCLKKKGDNDE